MYSECFQPWAVFLISVYQNMMENIYQVMDESHILYLEHNFSRFILSCYTMVVYPSNILSSCFVSGYYHSFDANYHGFIAGLSQF